ncbi:S26 family signal peptidase [Paracoccus onubensis]|uniref:S26 family signal peptidase n=1 Tax=Paracoccus onubensis TaxID=1675788 RepID=A0A418T1V5_9RHOB|nr:S26 family signal peptidase [Paracoccus onubensis]RJE87192.1 S26 family signal peptidase [Paracoccus onubensis]
MTRRGYVMIATVSVLGIAAVSVGPIAPKLVWSATASVPIGLYLIAPSETLALNDLVAVMPPEPFAGFMVERGYIARDTPILKHVMGLPGQRVCRTGRNVTIDANPLGEARERDSRGRDLPVWQGCRQLADGNIFLMNPQVGDSLDGRYFGPFPASSVIGRAVPILTLTDGTGRLNWRG